MKIQLFNHLFAFQCLILNFILIKQMLINRIIIIKAMFDILDDNINLTNLSISPGSRSASMKKIPKKQNRPSLFQQSKSNNSQNRDFNDLISGFLDKQSKLNGQNSENMSRTTSKKGNFDSLDFNFDEIGKFKSTVPINNSVVNSFGRPMTAKNSNDYAGQQEHLLSNHFGRTQQTILNPSKVEESFVSTRQMKPPIKRRENMSYMSGNILNSEIGMAIPEEDATISNSSNELYHSKPARSVNRRSSIDARSEINLEESFTLKNQPINQSISFKKEDRIKEEPLEKLSNTESHIIGWGHNDTGFKFGSNFGKNELSSAPAKQKQQKQDKILQNSLTEAEISERINKSNKAIISDYQRQIDLMKTNYQRQNDFLQENLDKQISENRQLREKFIKETGKMIDEERSRAKKMHEEEVSSLKDMFEWQKKKITETLKSQIESLKSIIDFKRDTNNSKPSLHQKFQLQNQETKLKLWQASLEEKSRMLERRQNDLQEAINQLNSQKRQQDERVRRQQRRVMQLQMNYKRQMLTQKKQLAEQKQKMSVQIGNLELEIIKRKETNQINARENEIERQSIEKQKEQLRRMNYEVMQTHKQNLEEIQQERSKISHIQLELLKKLRVVQLKAQEAQISRNNEEDILPVSYQLAKANQKEKYQPVRRISKESNTKSMSNLLKTKQRFYEVEINTRSKLNTSIKDHKKLDLGHYMSRIEHFSKAKQ